MAKITIYGTGYVGLVTGVCFAELGHSVCCMDVDEHKIHRLRENIPSIYEEGLTELLRTNQQAGRLQFTSQFDEAVEYGFYHFIAVGTPEGASGKADLTFVEKAVASIASARKADFILVNKSTVPVGTVAKMYDIVADELKKNHRNIQFDVIANPEFLREGSAVWDCLNPDRIILGGEPLAVEKTANDLYSSFAEKHVPILKMDWASAELTKYASNAMLAAKISFINEMSIVAELTGANIENVREGMALDPRIGPHFISTGCGYGGSCFPKDVKALSALAKQYDFDPVFLDAIDAVNIRQIERFSQKIIDYLDLENRHVQTIALWGLAFKPGTDDIRESPAIRIAEILSKKGAKIRAYDPLAMDHLSNFPMIEKTASPYDTVKGADALVIATDWDIFKQVDLKKVQEYLKIPVIFDGRNLYSLDVMRQMKLDYFSVGRPSIKNRSG